jgi:glycosyltransferase involved in cell wall biosynthesis
MEVPRKILYVVTKANWGGAQRYVFDLATHLPPEFAASVAYGQPGLLAEKLQEAGVALYPIQSLQRDVSIWADIKSFFELYRLVLEVNPDVVHLNSSKAGAVGALAAWLAGARRIIFTSHGWPFNERRGTLARALIWLASWVTALLCDEVIAVSESELRAAKRMPFCAGKAVRIYNGIDLNMQFGNGEAIRSAFPAGARIVGTVGELTRNKNQIELIERAKKDSAMHVAIIGEGELRGALEAKIREYKLEDRVKLFGFMPASEVLKGFDMFALPSLKEGLGYVLLEARAAGLPIEASRVGGTPEALDKDMGEFSLERMVEKTVAAYKTT